MTPAASASGTAIPLPAPTPAGPSTADANCPVVIPGKLKIPGGITGLDSFRRWAHSDSFPEGVRIAFLDGTIWVDLDMEQAFSHNDVKHEVAGVLRSLARADRSGRYIGDGMRLSHPGANLSTDPDGLYYSFTTQDSGKLLLVPSVQNVGVVELEGTPDMVLEVVSDSSVEKDTKTLPVLYHRAGVPEFWRIDARGELRFEILRRGDSDWHPTQLADGWWRSAVFARDFRLVAEPDPRGNPWFTLEFRAIPAA